MTIVDWCQISSYLNCVSILTYTTNTLVHFQAKYPFTNEIQTKYNLPVYVFLIPILIVTLISYYCRSINPIPLHFNENMCLYLCSVQLETKYKFSSFKFGSYFDIFWCFFYCRRKVHVIVNVHRKKQNASILEWNTKIHAF